MEAASVEPTPESSLSKPILSAGPGMILGILLLGEFMILLDTTIVNVAVPSITSSLHASLDQVLWVLNAYILTFAVLLITSGRLGDIIGPKKLYVGGMVLFTLASLACALAQTPNQLIVFRVVQAIGAASLTPQPGTIITTIFPPERRGQAFGVMGMVIGVAAVTGPTLGGLLTSAFSWRAIFIPNVPIGVISAVLAFLIMPELRFHRRRELDLVGVVLVSVGLFAGIYGLIEGQRYGWGRITNVARFDVGSIHASLFSIPTVLLASVIFLVAFVLWEMRQEEPLLPLSLFRERNFSLGNVILGTSTFCMLGLMIPLLLFLQSVRGLTAVEAGIAIVPNALMVMIAAPMSGRFIQRVKNARFFPIAGMISYAIGMALIIRSLSLNATGIDFTIPLLFTGLGVGLTVAPTVTIIMDRIAPTAAGAASGFGNTIRQVGAALATAVVSGAVLQNRLTYELHSQAVHYAGQLPAAFRAAFISGFTNASSRGLDVGRGQTGTSALPHNVPPATALQIQGLAKTVFDHAFINALRPTFLVPIGVALFSAVLAIFIRSLRAAPAKAVEPIPGVPAVERVGPAQMPMVVPMGVSDTIVLPSLGSAMTIAARPERPIRSPFLARLGDGPQTEYPVRHTLTIGRLPNNDVVLDDPKVSRRHTELIVQDGIVVARDLQSANGTQVNGQSITRDQPLHNGDVVTVGDTSFAFHNDYEVARPRLVTPEGREYPLKDNMTIGRLPNNDIVLNDPKASRHHAEIELQNGRVVIRDLESLNGTEVNGAPISSEQPLSEGDTVSIGDTSLVYKSDFAPVPA